MGSSMGGGQSGGSGASAGLSQGTPQASPQLDSPFAQPPPIPGTSGAQSNPLGLSQDNIMSILLGKAPVPGTVMGPGAAVAAPQLSAVIAKPAVA